MRSSLTRTLALAAPMALLAACATEPASTGAAPAPAPAPTQTAPAAPPPVVTAPPAAPAVTPVNMSVRQAQQRLLDKGYNPGDIDGIPGPRTSNALRQFQRDQGLMSTGRLDAVTIEKLAR